MLAFDRQVAIEGDHTLASFSRGLHVLLVIAERGPLRVDEIAAALEYPVSTIYRYLRPLKDLGLICERDGSYELGPRLAQLTARGVGDEFLLARSGPLLTNIAAQTGETAIMTVRSGAAALCLNSVESSLPVRLSFERGAVHPLYAGASAKVLLAYAPEAVLHDLLRTGLRKFTRNTPDAATLLRQLAEIRQRGYAMTDSEIDPDATAVAVPVQWGDMVVCGLSVAGPAFRFTPARQRKALMLLRRAARQLRGVLDSRAARRRRLRNIAVQEV